MKNNVESMRNDIISHISEKIGKDVDTSFDRSRGTCKGYLKAAFISQNIAASIGLHFGTPKAFIIGSPTPQWVVESPGLTGEPGTVSLTYTEAPYVGWYLRHSNYRLQVDDKNNPSLPQYFIKDATWRLIPNKYFKNYMTFQSVNYPDRFIRHQSWALKLHQDDGSELFKKDASFLQAPFSSLYGKCE
ncbi:unnamed protein product [Owenia fusiformis]|uniref:Alpha-L-arabinofuranosidase B arabinose-binding domain-containing protein n=1 Tax=Owenia fusiformis TaxID=6347 RepID=A0A8J1Y6U6_OWEFU|nr:unnamed protein product [Owenia fusiformis]